MLQNIKFEENLDCLSGLERKIMLMSDLHLGSSSCDEDAVKADLDWAKRENAQIYLLGDIVDMILPKDMKRYQPSAVVKGLRSEDDLVGGTVRYAAEFLDPYKDLIRMISEGNHEGSVLQYHGFDPISALIGTLDCGIVHGGVGGYIQNRYACEGSNNVVNLRIRYHHGAGGSAPRTLGVMSLADMGAYSPDADIVWQGHKHNKFANGTTVIEKLKSGTHEITYEKQVQLMTGGYLQPNDGYALKKGLRPQNKGGVMVVFTAGYTKKGVWKDIKTIL